MKTLFPPIEPYSSGYLAVEAPHEIYWEECGNPDGVPIVFLHGGPGAGCGEKARQFFDPTHYRIILFDQRGAARSKPFLCLENNTTAHLVADIEALRVHLGIDKWHVFGGSWGSTLALSYAAAHADSIISMILRGIFLVEQTDLDWFFKHNQYVWPEAYAQLINHIPVAEQSDLISAYHKRLTSDKSDIQLAAALVWSAYESACATLIPNDLALISDEQKTFALSIAVIECHYFHTQVITPEESLLTKIDAFRHVPTRIIQGRYDMVCPIITADRLHQAWPEAEYIIVPDGGHSAYDPAICSRLIDATEHAKNAG